MAARRFRSLATLDKAVSRCRDCERLVAWRAKVSAQKRAAYRDQRYWGRGVPGFGVAEPRVMVVGLAPGAHGANRTGRQFTGDRSGDWLYRALFEAGFANQAQSTSREDGLVMRQVRVTSAVKCAPPDNKVARDERDRCRSYFVREIELASELEVLVCLGAFAWDNCLWALRELGHQVRPKPRFAHGAQVQVGPYRLIGSYHPSQQNTFTGRLTREMLAEVFEAVAHALASRRST